LLVLESQVSWDTHNAADRGCGARNSSAPRRRLHLGAPIGQAAVKQPRCLRASPQQARQESGSWTAAELALPHGSLAAATAAKYCRSRALTAGFPNTDDTQA